MPRWTHYDHIQVIGNRIPYSEGVPITSIDCLVNYLSKKLRFPYFQKLGFHRQNIFATSFDTAHYKNPTTERRNECMSSKKKKIGVFNSDGKLQRYVDGFLKLLDTFTLSHWNAMMRLDNVWILDQSLLWLKKLNRETTSTTNKHKRMSHLKFIINYQVLIERLLQSNNCDH